MTPFLRLVAEAYIDNEPVENLADYCFVFPNKRSGLFFRKHLMATLACRGITAAILPAITSIDRFIASLTPEATEATRYDKLFTLYREYRNLSSEELDFDRFRFWGEMLLKDFDDIDRYRVRPHEIFGNLKELREINSTYLTSQQREAIKLYLGDDLPDYPIDTFWTHIGNSDTADNDGSGTSRFRKLWEILAPLYDNFFKRLNEQNLTTSGQLYRHACDNLKERADELLHSRRYVFVGFNLLSVAEAKVMDYLKARGMADFYWDNMSPIFKDNKNRAARLINSNARIFKSLYPLHEESPSRPPHIDIVAVPSKVGQAKHIGTVLQRLSSSGQLDCGNATNTAIVLPDESLLVPLVHSLPEHLDTVNITMGYPMKLTPLASLFRRIISLHLRAGSSRDHGRHFYYADVLAIASHPLLNTLPGNVCLRLEEHINDKRLFNISATEIEKNFSELSPLFKDVKDLNDFGEIYSYMTGVLDFLAANMSSDDTGASPAQRTLSVLEVYRASIDELASAVSRFNITMHEKTVFQLIESAVSSATVNFSGEPLKGLQIMGMLETRALDFENVIISSLNERIYPRRMHSGSFIPDTIRAAFGLGTTRHREAMSAYYFYRLLSRARSVTLLYDSRTAGVHSNERSRYITQLLYLYGDIYHINHSAATYSSATFDDIKPQVGKTRAILETIAEFTRPGGRSLSPSSIKTFTSCPLQFYLSYIKGLREPDDITDYMDTSTYGRIVHKVAEDIYKEQRDRGVKTFDTQKLDEMLNDTISLQRHITIAINELYNKLGENNTTSLEGESFALGRLIMFYITTLLRQEKEHAPFEFIDGEIESRLSLPLPGADVSINLSQIIDRVDRVDVDTPSPRLRIIDYKTGDENVSLNSLESIFSPDAKWPKGVLQLMIYCNSYALTHKYKGPIQPMIYNFKHINTSGLTPVTLNKVPVTDYREINDTFMELFSAHMKRLFDMSVPFIAAENDDHCKFCNFKPLCGKEHLDEKN